MTIRSNCKRAYDDKVNEILGMNYQTARSQLERKILWYMAKQLNKHNCFQCGFEIKDSDDMSIEHMKPWGGNEGKGIKPDASLFWNMDNIAFSHKICNVAGGPGGSGKYTFVGIHDYIDKRKTPEFQGIRSMITINSKSIVLGVYQTQEEAAIAYDLGLIVYRDGIGKLNFPQFREQYIEKLKAYNISNTRFFSEQKNPIKSIVAHFCSQLNLNSITK